MSESVFKPCGLKRLVTTIVIVISFLGLLIFIISTQVKSNKKHFKGVAERQNQIVTWAKDHSMEPKIVDICYFGETKDTCVISVDVTKPLVKITCQHSGICYISNK